jgi:hypothetical protein
MPLLPDQALLLAIEPTLDPPAEIRLIMRKRILIDLIPILAGTSLMNPTLHAFNSCCMQDAATRRESPIENQNHIGLVDSDRCNSDLVNGLCTPKESLQVGPTLLEIDINPSRCGDIRGKRCCSNGKPLIFLLAQV